MDASNILFRCSSLGYIMTNDRSGKQMGETCKNHLVDKFISVKYGRKTDIQTKYTNKGLMVEEDSLTLYSLYTKDFLLKNKQVFSNEFICGTPDVILADKVIDIKSSWDIFTFFRASHEKVNQRYYWQLMGYMALTGKKTATLAYCLINTPDCLIHDEKRRLMYKMNVIDDRNTLYEEACSELDKQMIYDDIPLEEKVNEIIVERDEDAIQAIYARVKECREYMDKNLFRIELVEA